jgi:hypothetical protein
MAYAAELPTKIVGKPALSERQAERLTLFSSALYPRANSIQR